jgi:hypothetical protein
MKIEKANISPGGREGADLGFPLLFGVGRPEEKEEEDPVGGEYPSPRREHFVVGPARAQALQAGPRLARTAATRLVG